ncbi:TetR family transcriptional regulator [Kribbella sp. C-35]|uniref:TetR/AcrR family transcriptional regulator n=1 Tax=Kribbella sp. C-35 TaxID=2789276 RepID=UPI00397CE731
MDSSTSADTTRDRIVAAAKAEFSRYGIAGARIERIAKAAKTSKERLYAYFRSKEALYHFVAEQELAAVAEATRLDPTDLPGYAGRVHDYFVSHPDRLRIIEWGRLELGSDGSRIDDATQEVVQHKVEQLRQAQEAGQLDSEWEPIDILVFVNQIAVGWAGQVDFVDSVAALVRDPSPSARHAAVVAAVQRLFPAGGQPGQRST